MPDDTIEQAKRVLLQALRETDRHADSATVRDLCAATASLERAKLDRFQTQPWPDPQPQGVAGPAPE